MARLLFHLLILTNVKAQDEARQAGPA